MGHFLQTRRIATRIVWPKGGPIWSQDPITVIDVDIQIYLISGWWFEPTPLKNDGVKVSWGDEIPNIWKVIKFMFQTTNQITSCLTPCENKSQRRDNIRGLCQPGIATFGTSWNRHMQAHRKSLPILDTLQEISNS